MSFPFQYAIITSAKRGFHVSNKGDKILWAWRLSISGKRKKSSPTRSFLFYPACQRAPSIITSGATKDPKLETLKALARVLDCSLSDFDDPKERHFAERTDQEVLQNRIHILTEYFQRMGILQPGGDISGQDLEFFKGLLSLIDAYFGKKEEADR